jgi:hypothetical protein
MQAPLHVRMKSGKKDKGEKRKSGCNVEEKE